MLLLGSEKNDPLETHTRTPTGRVKDTGGSPGTRSGWPPQKSPGRRRGMAPHRFFGRGWCRWMVGDCPDTRPRISLLVAVKRLLRARALTSPVVRISRRGSWSPPPPLLPSAPDLPVAKAPPPIIGLAGRREVRGRRLAGGADIAPRWLPNDARHADKTARRIRSSVCVAQAAWNCRGHVRRAYETRTGALHGAHRPTEPWAGLPVDRTVSSARALSPRFLLSQARQRPAGASSVLNLSACAECWFRLQRRI